MGQRDWSGQHVCVVFAIHPPGARPYAPLRSKVDVKECRGRACREWHDLTIGPGHPVCPLEKYLPHSRFLRGSPSDLQGGPRVDPDGITPTKPQCAARAKVLSPPASGTIARAHAPRPTWAPAIGLAIRVDVVYSLLRVQITGGEEEARGRSVIRPGPFHVKGPPAGVRRVQSPHQTDWTVRLLPGPIGQVPPTRLVPCPGKTTRRF